MGQHMTGSSASDGCPSPVTMMLPRQSSVGSPLASNAGGSRAFSPLSAAPSLGLVGRASSQPVPAAMPSDDSAAAARLAAAAALVSKSVRKSADFNPPVAGSRTSFADPSNNFQHHHQVQIHQQQQQTNKRSSFAGTPTSRTEFILNTPTSSSSGWTQHPLLLLEGGPSSLPYQQQQSGMDSLTSSRGSLYSEADGQMTTRIRKSFEQKEEFLKRPALPYWVSVQEAQQSPPVTKEFYAQPQKFARPVWPPAAAVVAVGAAVAAASASAHAPSTTSTTSSLESLQDARQMSSAVPVVTAIEPWSMVFTSNRGTPPPALGLVPNTVPKPFYGSAASSSTTGQPNSPSSGNRTFHTTLTRIQENITDPTATSAADANQLQQQKRLDLPDLKSRSAAPLASPEEFFTPSPTKAAQHPLAAAVIRRAKQIENGHQPPATTPLPQPSSTARPANVLSPAEKSLLQRIAQRSHIGRPIAADASAANAPLLRAGILRFIYFFPFCQQFI